MDRIPPGSSVHGISQARILEWVAISFPRTSSWPRDRTQVSCIVRKILYHWATREAQGKYRGTNIYLTVFPFWGKVIFLSHTKCAPSGYSPRALQWHPMLGSFLPASSVTHTFKQGTCWRQIWSEFFSQADEKLDLVIIYFKTGKDLRCHDRRPLVVLRHLPPLFLPGTD